MELRNNLNEKGIFALSESIRNMKELRDLQMKFKKFDFFKKNRIKIFLETILMPIALSNSWNL